MINFLIAAVFISVGWFANTAFHLPSGTIREIVRPHPLEKYSIENLAKTDFKSSDIKIEGNLFSFYVDGLPAQASKKVTGQINIPKGDGPFSIIVMFRGYVDQKSYKTGDGTRRAAEFFAKNGFITIAPDFLGYGESDPEASNIFESRFQTYTTALTLLKSIEKNSLPKWDNKNIFIWGHSNGGQIALATLEVTGKPYPTVLWAPNSAKFPYSILYYLDEASDEGKLIITKLAEFMESYDVKNYSIRNYFDKINPETKIQIHQGLSDDAVPVIWTNSLTKEFLALNIDLDYLKYPGADHNLQPSWNKAVIQSLTFFKKSVK